MVKISYSIDRNKECKRTFLVATIYSLYVYLLYSTYEEFLETNFILMDTIPKSVRDNIKRQIYVNKTHYTRYEYYKLMFQFVFLRKLYAPSIDKSKIYAQDHLPISPFIIRNNSYTFVEDGPNIFSLTRNTKMFIDCLNKKEHISYFQKIKNNLISRASFGIMANNKLCKEIIVTTDDTIDYLEGKKITKICESQQWANASVEKKNNILRIFNITENDILFLRRKHIIVFTQPFYNDGELSFDEHIKIYQDIISKYGIENLIFKTHPRDKIDYKAIYQGLYVFDKPIPFQLLILLNIKYDIAVTVCSTAVMSIPYDIKIDWIGAEVHPNLLKAFGNYIPSEIASKRI